MASQTLLSLVARLQRVMSVAQGREMLLDYARKICGARLALLFLLARDRQVLTLLEYSGRHPSSFSPENSPLTLSLQGLFASVLQEQDFLDIPDISRNALSLPEERAWAWPRSRVLLHALRQGQCQGVLVFCFGPSGARSSLTTEMQNELLICLSLLSSYLGAGEEIQPVYPPAESPEQTQQPAGSNRRSQTIQDEQEAAPPPEAAEIVQFAEVVDLLLALCELGLTTGEKMDDPALGQHILSLLGSSLHATTGYLWRYQPADAAFYLQSTLGEPGPLAEYATAEINRLARTFQGTRPEPIYGLLTLPTFEGQVLIWQTLSYREQLLGVIGLQLPQAPALLLDQRLLLNAACDIIALLLLHQQQHRVEQRVLIEQERSRIAREMHDSVMQDVAHVTQKLDYIQRILEKQPQTALSEIEQARELLNRSLSDLRYGISSLLPLPLEEQAFDEALKALLHEYSLSSPALKITYEAENLARWPQALRAPIYRFMQEALNNIRKHAAASEVHIRIRHVAGLGFVQISDNGQGFVPAQFRRSPPDPTSATLHMGLQTMEERIRQIGGTLEIHSTPGEGTTLKARFPLTQSSSILTEREREVLRLMVDGLTNRAISERLSVSLETVKSHVHHIMQKMHVKDRTQAAVVATRQHWL